VIHIQSNPIEYQAIYERKVSDCHLSQSASRVSSTSKEVQRDSMDSLPLLILENPNVRSWNLFQWVASDELMQTHKINKSEHLLFFSMTDRDEAFLLLTSTLQN
jgi:hypothetical protein